jgi:hypothetical protein
MQNQDWVQQPMPRQAGSGLFLDDAELHQLTARKYKSKQIEWLRAQGIPFRVSATGHPVVTRAVVEGRHVDGGGSGHALGGWAPRVLRGA